MAELGAQYWRVGEVRANVGDFGDSLELASLHSSE